MNILISAGNTIVPIDRVRCITNVFTGRTGTTIALHSHQRGHNVRFHRSTPSQRTRGEPQIAHTLAGPSMFNSVGASHTKQNQ